MRKEVQKEVNRLVKGLKESQALDGSWDYPFETGIITDCYMIILLRTLEINDDEKLIRNLVNRILSKQNSNGAWTLYYDEGDGNLTTTVEAYYALLYSGYIDKDERRMQKAKKFIIENGNLDHVSMFAKIILAITGQTEWDFTFPVPVEGVLLSTMFPINFYDISVFGRSNIAPILILADYRFTIKAANSPNLSHLLMRKSKDNETILANFNESRSLLDFIKEGIDSIKDLSEEVHEKALLKLENYMMNRIEQDGTFYSYFSATFLMIFALLAREKDRKAPIILNAIKGLKSMICEIDGLPHCQYTTANVWNTALISDGLQRAGVAPTSPIIHKANHFLLTRQQFKYGDWAIHNKNTLPGGWGFSKINTINPDVDDTTAVLRAIRMKASQNAAYRNAWDRGINWVLSMQNDDGGWPAFEKDIDNSLLTLLPGGENLLLDASSTDLTGRTLEFLGRYTSLNHENDQIKKGVKWLLKNQEMDGSWDSRWGICYIYGTWSALIGLTGVGVSQKHPSIVRAIKWLLEIQNADGGWGESCRSDSEKHYIPLGVSTLTHTAWALDALIAISDTATHQINKGINFLIENADIKDWRTDYPKGQGAGGVFYIHYHSYRFIWPLNALTRYLEKFK